MQDLIAMLEKAEAGSRKLDVEIARGIGNPDVLRVDADETVTSRSANVTGLHWEAPNCVGNVFVPRYTTSLDAAMTLVPEGWDWSISFPQYKADNRGGFFVYVREWRDEYVAGRDREGSATTKTPALALCIAALKARNAIR